MREGPMAENVENEHAILMAEKPEETTLRHRGGSLLEHRQKIHAHLNAAAAAEREPTVEDHATAREEINRTRTLRVTAANDKLKNHWKELHTFVQNTEESGLLLPMQCPCCKISCVRKERYFMSVCPLIMFAGFMGIVYGMVTENDSSPASSAPTNSNVTLDARAKMLADQEAQNADPAVLTALGAMLTTTTIAFILFCVARTRVPALYAHRNADEFALSQGFLSWLPQLISMNESDLLYCVGFDAFMFLRLPQLTCKFCTLVFFPVGLPLMLVNLYAEGYSDDSTLTDSNTTNTTGLATLTLANVPKGSPLLWIHVVAAWYVTWLLLKLVDEEQRVYIRARHLYLHQARAQDYSIFVQDLPEDVRTPETLTRLFQQFYPAEEIHSACVIPDCRELDAMLAKAKTLSKKLEDLVAADETGKHKTRACCGEQFSDAIPKAKAELIKLNSMVRKEQQAVMRRMHTTRAAEKAADKLLLAEAAKELSQPVTSPAARALREKKRVELETKKRLMQAREKSEKFPLIELLTSATCGAVDNTHGDTRQHGIVTFNSLRTATIARQVVHDSHKLKYELIVNEAMDPRDIEWKNMGMDYRERLLRQKLGTAMDVWLLALFSVPIAAISAACTPESVSKAFPFVESFVYTPSVKAFMEGTLQSIVMTKCLNFLPAILRFTSIYEGFPTQSEVDRYTVQKYFFFLFFNVYMLTSFAKGLMEELEALLEDPKELPNVLAKTLPSSSNTFLSYILINGITTWSVFILQAGDMVKCWILKQPYKPDLTLTGVGVVGRTETTVVAPKLLLILLLAISYATVAPIVLMPAAMAGAVIHVVHKFLFVYVTTPTFESGGKAWHLYAQCIVFALGVAQFMLFGILGLKEGYTQAACMWPLLFLTYHHFIDVAGQYEDVAANLPLLECHAVGEMAGPDAIEKDLSFLHHAYYPDMLACELPRDATTGTKWDENRPASSTAVATAGVDDKADVELPAEAEGAHGLKGLFSDSVRLLADTSTVAGQAVVNQAVKRP